MLEKESKILERAKEIAEVGNITVDAVIKIASFIDDTFGNFVSKSFGIIGDKLAYYRLSKAIELQETVDQKLNARGVKERYVPLTFGLPIIEKATIEEEPLLQDKWANLLANARDATFNKPIRRNFTSILADMEPIDTQILDIIVRQYLSLRDKNSSLFSKHILSKNTKIPVDEVENSLRNLMRLGLLKPGVVTGGLSIGEHLVSSYKDTELFGVTGLGVDFFYAVNEDR